MEKPLVLVLGQCGINSVCASGNINRTSFYRNRERKRERKKAVEMFGVLLNNNGVVLATCIAVVEAGALEPPSASFDGFETPSFFLSPILLSSSLVWQPSVFLLLYYKERERERGAPTLL